MPFRCREKGCRKRFSVRTKSVMEASNLGYQTWAIAIYLLSTSLKSVSSMKLHRDLKISQKSAWFLAHRLRETWKRDYCPFSGPGEADKTYVGGKEGNKHRCDKLNAGREPVGKFAVAGLKDRETNFVSAAVVEGTNRTTLHNFIEERVINGATVYTDEATAYKRMRFYEHGTIRHGRSEYVRGEVHTNGTESFWSMLKRAHKGTLHKMSEKHLPRYVDEFVWRHNARELGTVEQMKAVVRGMMRRRLRYPDLIS